MANRPFLYGAAILALQALAGCSSDLPTAEGQQTAQQSAGKAPEAKPVENAALVVVFGDSLFAGYGLAPDEGFAPALERALGEKGIKARVFNAGVSGDTSAAGRQRLAYVMDGLERKPELVILGLGANDMLRGLSPDATRANLDAILAELKKRDVPVLLTGMLAAPNMGSAYAEKFNPIYPELAKKYGIQLDPFFLDGVIGSPHLLLEDGMHPNAKGVTAITTRVAPLIAENLEE